MIAFISILASLHVPQYACPNNCCHPNKDVTISQASYVKNSGGLEIPVAGLPTILEYDLVFKDKYDTTTYDVYVGCGGCEDTDTLPIALPTTYKSAKLEPFTQTAYYRLLDNRTFNTTVLSECTEDHMSIRLLMHANATEDMFYSIVLGCDSCESFSFTEQLSFPIYIIAAHGWAWNQMGWSLWLYASLSVVSLLVISTTFLGGFRILLPHIFYKDLDPFHSLRLFLYALATWAIIADILETLHHFAFAARVVPSNDGGYGGFAVILILKLLLLISVALPWFYARNTWDESWREWKYTTFCESFGIKSAFWAHAGWCWFDMVCAIGSLFIGAGFYIFSVAAFFAGALRLYLWTYNVPSHPYRIDAYPLGSYKSTETPSIFLAQRNMRSTI